MENLAALFNPASKVLGIPAADPERALRHFLGKLDVECDPSDLGADLASGAGGFVVLDVRSAEAYKAGHVPGARSLPHWEITPEAVGDLGLDKGIVYITYCWGTHCNGATKGAAKLAALGYRVKELIGGVPGWQAEGFPLETS